MGIRVQDTHICQAKYFWLRCLLTGYQIFWLVNMPLGQNVWWNILVTKETKGRFFFVPISKILVPTAFRMYFSTYIQFFLKLWYWAVSYFFVTTFFYYCQKYASILQMKPSHKIFFSCQKPFLWKCCKISCVRSHHSRLAMDYSGFFWLYVNIVIYSFKSHSENG